MTFFCTHVISACDLTGMEAAIANMLEPGETIVVGNNGIWGQRVTELAARYGGACTAYCCKCCLSHRYPGIRAF